MAYSDFKTINQVKTRFGLDIHLTASLTNGSRGVGEAPDVEPSDYLRTTLKRNLTVAFDNDTEKARSELIIAPLLIEVRELLDGNVSLFSGRDFTVDLALGLNGFCDYILSASAFTLEIEAPVITIVEAKNESTNVGLGQCIAAMVAAQKFNMAREQDLERIYGCVTTGRVWRFLQLMHQTVWIDQNELVIKNAEDSNIAKILTIFTEAIKPLASP